MTLMRLQRALARAGVTSRRKAEELIRAGRVRAYRARAVGPRVESEGALAEGRDRIVRRLAEAVGLKGEWLHRVAHGPVRLGRLAEGKYRRLAAPEIEAIERLHGTT